MLARIEAMPVSTWTYNTESDSVRHMGPTAQDFRKAFGLGDTEKAIATIDADAVSLAAIKALVQRTTQLRKENDDIKALIADLVQRLSQLEETDDGVWATYFNTVLIATLDERDYIMRG